MLLLLLLLLLLIIIIMLIIYKQNNNTHKIMIVIQNDTSLREGQRARGQGDARHHVPVAADLSTGTLPTL